MEMNSQILYRVILCFLSSYSVLSYAIAFDRHVKPLKQYIHRVWTNKEGLPHNSARALIQTQDGYLWIATQDGLVRFNGAAFQVFDKDNTPAIKHNDITALTEAANGTLWIGTYNGLTSLKDGIFKYHPINNGKELEIIRAFATDQDENLWIGTMNEGLKKFKDGKVEFITTAQGLSSNTVYAITEDYQGNIWIGTAAGVNIYRHGRWSYYNTKNGLPHETVHCIFIASDSTIWIGTNGGLVRWKKGFINVYTTANGLSHNVIRAIYEDRSGVLWIGTERGGICQLFNGTFKPYQSSDGLSGNFVDAILEDREENLWVGIYNGGLNQFWKGKFLNYTVDDGLPNTYISSVIQSRKGDIWVGTGGGGVLHFDGKKFTTFTMKDGLPHNSVRALFEDSRGSIWIGTQGGLAQYRSGKFKTYAKKEGLKDIHIRAIREDHNGSLWVGTLTGGIHRFENGQLVNYQEKGLPMDVIRSIYVDHSGAIWVGSNDAVRCWRNDTIVIYTQKDGLPFEPIYEMMEDKEYTLWMGSYGGGLVRLKDGKFTRFKHAQGLYNDVVYQILEDDYGYIWMGGMKGISYVSKKMLDDFADGKINRIQCAGYTTADGMVSGDCTGNTQSGGCKTSDGRLWFTTTEGICVVTPKDLHKNLLPPPVMIERVVINGLECSPYESKKIPVGNGQVEFHYSGLSYQVPEKVNFHYQLEGFEKEWRFVGIRHAAFYTNITPGKYVFRVSACNNDGLWNKTGASFSFELEPHFYQTIWFYGFVVIVVVGTVFGMYRIRVWRLMAREKMLKIYIEQAMAKIKVLSGLIPICASCKKVRDDTGYWNQLEHFINEHSEATFSHGICPDCAEKIYGGYLAKIKEKRGPILSQFLPTNSPKENSLNPDNIDKITNDDPPQ